MVGWLVGVHYLGESLVIIDLWMFMLGHCELSQCCCTCVVCLFVCLVVVWFDIVLDCLFVCLFLDVAGCIV